MLPNISNQNLYNWRDKNRARQQAIIKSKKRTRTIKIIPLHLIENDEFHERFNRKLSSEGHCKIWTGAKFTSRGKNKRGAIYIKGVAYLASRVAFAIATGDDPYECRVSQICGNSLCCNPNHLRLGKSL